MTPPSNDPTQIPNATLMHAVATWLSVSEPMANGAAAPQTVAVPGGLPEVRLCGLRDHVAGVCGRAARAYRCATSSLGQGGRRGPRRPSGSVRVIH